MASLLLSIMEFNMLPPNHTAPHGRPTATGLWGQAPRTFRLLEKLHEQENSTIAITDVKRWVLN